MVNGLAPRRAAPRHGGHDQVGGRSDDVRREQLTREADGDGMRQWDFWLAGHCPVELQKDLRAERQGAGPQVVDHKVARACLLGRCVGVIDVDEDA